MIGSGGTKTGCAINVYDQPCDEKEKKLLFTGTFHGFGQDIIYEENSSKQIVVAIVEDKLGCLDIVPVIYCQFVRH